MKKRITLLSILTVFVTVISTGASQAIAGPIVDSYNIIFVDPDSNILPNGACEAISKAVNDWNGEIPKNNVFYLIGLRWENNWALATLTSADLDAPLEEGMHTHLSDENMFSLILVRTEDGWEAAIDSSKNEVMRLLTYVPETELDSNARNVIFSLSQEEGITSLATQQYNNYKFPWPSGYAWRVTKTWHTTGGESGTNTLDFDILSYTNSDILAAASGIVTHICRGTAEQYYLRIVTDGTSDERVGYLHLHGATVRAEGITLGTHVTQGEKLGRMWEGSGGDQCGTSYGTHIHVHFPTKPFTIDNITFTSSDVHWGENLYSTQNIDETPPTKASNIRPNGWTGPYTSDTTPSFVWNAATDSDSGMAGYYVAVDDPTPEGGSGNDWWVGNVTSYTIPNALNDGEHYFAVTSKDNEGNINPSNTNIKGDAPYYTFYVDTITPSGSFIINSGASTTNTTQVILNNNATDATSGIQSMRIRNAGGLWGDWQAYSTNTLHLLPATTGQTYTVEVQYKDWAGNISSTASQSIALDIYPERPSSTGYTLLRSTVGNSTWNHQSTSYTLKGTSGQPSPAGAMNSTNYQLSSGYWSGRHLSLTPEQGNDNFDYATNIDELSFSDDIPTNTATVAGDDPIIGACGITGKGYATVWYKYESTSNSALSIDTYEATYDTFIAVWTGTRGDLDLVVCNDDANGTKQSALAFQTEPNTTYYIEIGQP